MNKSENLLIVADSEHDANLLYAVGMFVPDAFIFLRAQGRDYVVASDLEIGRVRKHAPHCEVLSLSSYQKILRRQGATRPGFADVIALVFRELGLREAFVPDNFPLGLAHDLKKRAVRVRPRQGLFFPERVCKSAEEVGHITAALRMAEIGLEAGLERLRAAQIDKKGRLLHGGRPLTSELLRGSIDAAIIQAGGLPAHTIAAGGKQGCDPHEEGHGPLRAHEPIIMDIFPRSQATGYFGDLTRTVVRGHASEAIRKLYATVQEGQKRALRKMAPGVATKAVHQTVVDYFESQGYSTGECNGQMQGFFHGTGHGVGLEIHEAPRLGTNSLGELRAGQVVTDEPGLYYPALQGGVRIEDMVVITPTGRRNLTRSAKVLEI